MPAAIVLFGTIAFALGGRRSRRVLRELEHPPRRGITTRRLATLREWAADADLEVVEGAYDPDKWRPPSAA
ncbi:MAG: hypothetical protein ACLTDR_01500 [Adlercreutzia equolifaciens]